MQLDPLHQFMVTVLIPLNFYGIDLSFTNASLFMMASVLIVLGACFIALRKPTLIPSRFQTLIESLIGFISEMLDQNVGKHGRRYFPFILSLFLFVLLGNLLGMLPYGFTFTSHIVVTFALGLLVFVITTAVGIAKHGLHFFRRFLPSGVPLIIAPIIIIVEVLSYLFRPVSLAVRLFANMLAGHVVLKLFAGFTIAMGLYGFLPLGLNLIFIGFELFVAGLQAYIFTILSCAYLNDTLSDH